MENLEKVLSQLEDRMHEIESSHDTDVFDFINLDEDCMMEFCGDWTEDDIKRYNYLFERAAALRQAKKIIKEEMIAYNMTHGIDDSEYLDIDEIHAQATLEEEMGIDFDEFQHLVSLKEWAEKNGISPTTARVQANNGKFKTARKIGRNWVIDSREVNIDRRLKQQ